MRFADHELLSIVHTSAAGPMWQVERPDGSLALGCLRDEGEARGLVARWEAWACVDSPHVVRLLDVLEDRDVDPDHVMVVMERVEGRPLDAVLAAGVLLTVEEREAIIAGVRAGVAALHGAGLVHGDVSPANVMVRAGGHAVLVDLLDGSEGEAGTPGFSGGGAAGMEGDLAAVGRIERELVGSVSRRARGESPAEAVRELGAAPTTRLSRRGRRRPAACAGSRRVSRTAGSRRVQSVALVVGCAVGLAVVGVGAAARSGVPSPAVSAGQSGMSASMSMSAPTAGPPVPSEPDTGEPDTGEPDTGEPDTGADQVHPCPDSEEATRILAQLVSARDGALVAGDGDTLARVESGGVLAADLRFVESLAAAGQTLSGLRTEVGVVELASCDDVRGTTDAGNTGDASSDASSDGPTVRPRVALNTTLRTVGYTICTAAAEDSGAAGACTEVAEGPVRDVLLTLEHCGGAERSEGAWRVIEVTDGVSGDQMRH